MKPDDKIILPDSPEAACKIMRSGWMSRDGTFYGDGPIGERVARLTGCTHVRCKKCGEIIDKHYVLCKECCDKADAERYAAMPRAKWDGKTPLYSEVTDRFYNSPTEASNEALDNGISAHGLRLVICEPVYATKLDSSYFMDDLGPDDGLPGEAVDAIDEFNRAMDGVIISWMPGKTALDLEEDA